MLWGRLNQYLSSSSFRFALVAMLVIWVCLALIIGGLYLAIQGSIWRALEWQLNAEEELILHEINNTPIGKIPDILAQLVLNPDSFLQLRDPEGKLLFSTIDPNLDQAHYDTKREQPTNSLKYNDYPKNLISREIALSEGHRILLTRRVNWLHDLNQAIVDSMMLGTLLTLALSVVASFLLTRRSLARIHQINRSCETIMGGQLSHRIPLANPDKLDDYDEMSKNLNQMLDRIQALMNQVKQVSNNIAHDLRSPLTRLRTKVEILQQKNKGIEIDSVLEEADHLLEMFNGLLKIARLESNSLSEKQAVPMNKLIDDVADMFGVLFEENNVEFHVDSEVGSVLGDKNLLFQAMVNLLDNAVKYTPPGGLVKLVSRFQGEYFIVTINDSGPGIPEDEQERVFDKFVRLDDARSSPGFGLGLSQVRAIVSLHNGTVSLSKKDGLQVLIKLPLN